ncbi:acyl transferase domain-containing protein [Phthorimaea operculella]|nr:acyl transferase domain-containing protein [Phthorimaea operculella]
MAPSPQEKKDPTIKDPQRIALTGEEVVISGISGQFPQSKNVMEFMDNLYNKVDMITKNDAMFEHADLPMYSGKISEIEKFDAHFFRVTHDQADSLDPLGRKLMEHAYGALYDAGINPILCKGKKIGVFISVYNTESFKLLAEDTKNPFVMSGLSKAMHANRISYWLDAKGPSFTFDDPAGSVLAVQHAVRCIKAGECEAAIVGSGELALDPVFNINMRQAGISCLDSKTRCFDKKGDGSVLSSAIGLLFLQKAKDAKRIYAEVCSSAVKFGPNGDNISQVRDQKRIVEFLNNVYSESGLLPINVEYVEAHGAAHPEADANELEAIAQVFAKQEPVMVGCVKSNMGNSLPASSICSITKLCLAYNKGQLPGNLHYDDPLDTLAVKSKKVEILTNNKCFNRGLAAINSFSHTGVDSHLVLKGHRIPKNLDLSKIGIIPRLVLVSGRTEEAVQAVFDNLRKQPLDAEFIGMLNDIYQVETPGFTCRGYTILDFIDTDLKKTKTLYQSTHLNREAAPPLWFLYSGMGSQWAGMGKELMKIPMFATAVKKCHKILEPKGVDVIEIITTSDATIFDNVLNCFIGIAAVQIGLTNMLKALGLVADNIIGHSVGELGCAYYDDCFTDEEMMLAAHARGLASIQTKLIKGSMAAVGLGYADMLPLCPPSIDIACRNSSEVCTISGPADDVKSFVADLTTKGIFAKDVPCGNIAYHSKYIEEMGPPLLKELKKIIKSPIKRSENWISTSCHPGDTYNSESAKMCSAEYHNNNLLSPVYFEEAAKLIPENAVVVEVAPHGIMQAILKRSHTKCTHIPLTRRDDNNPLQYLFKAFGRLYEMGYNIKISELYPKIQYPVSTETSPLSHLVEWYHEDDWPLHTSSYTRKDKKNIACSRKLAISIEDDDFTFLKGHIREGKNVLPEAAVLVYVWETLAMYKKVDYTVLPITFDDVRFHTEVFLGLEDSTNLKIAISKGTDYFEVTNRDVIVASGFVNTFARNTKKPTIVNSISVEENETDRLLDLCSEDIYQIFKLKGYFYRDDFQRLYSSSHQLSHASIKMTGSWVTFIDALIQCSILVRDYDGVSVPKIIKSLKIDTTEHFYKVSNNIKDQKTLMAAQFNKFSGAITSGGVKIDHIIFNDKPVAEFIPDVLETMRFDHIEEPIQEFKLINAKPGDITGMQWEELAEMNSKSLVKVCFAALSMKDVQNAVGIGHTTRTLGMDFSGIDINGNRVMGLVAKGAVASSVEPDADLLWPVPEHWSFEEAATVPLPYVHAYYCLVVRGCLRAGQTVFITGGAGALGQAVISICLSLNCILYTSVRDIKKKRFLKRLFPSLNENHIGSSRDTEFYNNVVCHSKNKRCHFVINCATGFVRELAMKCVGFTGIFLDVTDYDIKNNIDMGMDHLDEDRAYVTVDLSYLFKPDKTEERKLLHAAVSEGIAKGTIKPLSNVVYSAKDVTKAFRLISNSNHRGRVLIKMRDSDAPLIPPSVIPRKTCSTKSNILIFYDETEVGLKLADHLVKRGAKNLTLCLKSEKIARFIQIRLAKWRKMGVQVRISTCDLRQIVGCVKVMNFEEMIQGIFIIKPKRCDNMFCTVVANLDNVSRNNHPELEHFVILARNPEDYAVSTKHLNNVMNTRAEIGLPALLVQVEEDDCHVLIQKHPEIQPITGNTAFEELEGSLKQYNSNFDANNKAIREKIFFVRICEFLGIKSINTIDEEVYLKDLVFNHVNLEELKFFFKENYNTDYSTEEIGEMTIHTIKTMSTTKFKNNTNFNVGFDAFYKIFNSDAVEATEIFIPIPTFISNAEGIKNLHAKARNILLLPGFEGGHRIFTSLGKRLKIGASALQLGPDIANESIQKIALNLKQRLMNRFILEPKFYLLGYSFGVNVSLELAALLEKDGLVGTVFCLDSSPDALRVQLDAYIGKLSEDQLQNAVIKHMFHLMSGITSASLETQIENIDDWSGKVALCIQNLKQQVSLSHEYMRDIIETFYERIGLAKTYKPKFKLKSDIVLLKGISHPNATKLDDDYGLSKYAENPVKVFDINSDVALAPHDCRVANVVNNLLEPELLKEFKAKNHCECYE